MEILISIIEKMVEYTVEPVFRELGYLCFINSNFQELKSQVEKLKDTRESVQHMVHNARRNAEDIKPEVEKWLNEVDKIIRKSEAILENEGQLNRLCSNLVKRHKFSRKARKLADDVLKMKNEGNFGKVSYNLPGPLVGSSLQKNLDFLDFESRKSIMEQIMDALFDDNVNRIGVYGMGGVGKTMLVKEILRKITEKKSFDEVVMSTISRTPNLKKIQGQLADMLGLKLEQETIEGRAFKLQKRLKMKMEKSILIVFDDVWEFIDLEAIGIPNVMDDKGCKILFTSRNNHLLSNEMWVNKTFEIKVLKEEESWDLFKTMVGEIVEELKPTANQIVMECARLPIAITTVAKALRNKPPSIWKDALDQLKNFVAVNIKGMDNKVYSSLKLSYDYLECEEVKLLFLLCSMFPEDFEINVEDLQVYAMGMGFLHGVDTMAQGRRRIIKLVDDLISSSLLLQNESEDNHVKMHDLVHDVAIRIASKNEKIRTLSYVKRENKEWEEEELLGNHTAVYLNVQGLPMKLMLYKVHLLRIDGPWSGMCNLVETFFEEMKELKGVELQRMQISLFPPSLYSFANIRLLHLVYCELGSVDMIGELKKLEILSFKGSNIVQIPMTINQLKQLKVLDLSLCKYLKVIPPNVLSSLTKLEELYLETFDRWEREEWCEGRKNASLSELRYLPHLYALHLTIQDEKIMPKQLFSKELDLEMFLITIGYHRDVEYSRKHSSRMLCLKMESECCLDDWIKKLLKRSEKLDLVGAIGTMVLHSELDENDSLHLKHLWLVDNLKIQHFIHEQNKPLRRILSNLEYLGMHNLKNLESIIHGYVKESPFNKLRIVNIRNCNKLGTLFFNCILDDVLNLEKIDISYCEMVEEIILMENKEATNQIELTHLKSLCLYELPRLQHFCSKIEKLGQSNLDDSKKIETSTIINGASFFSEQVSLPNLEELSIDGADNLKMIWHNNILIPNSFSKLKEVEISSCSNLEKVFPSNIINMLTCLNSLKIGACNLLAGIFEVQELNVIEKSVKLPNLRRLELFNLPNLKYVWNKDFYELLIFEDLADLMIDGCPKLKRAYPVKIFKQLGRLEIDFGDLIEALKKEKTMHMFESTQFETSKGKTTKMQDGPELFSKLKSLTIFGSLDYNLSELPMEVVRILHNQLEEFELSKTFIEEIFSSERFINVEKNQNSITSLPLWRLHLSQLPKLRHLWKETSQKINISSLEKLGDLTILRCSQLNTLFPSSMSFTNLSLLELEECHRLTHLLDPTVARGLVQLYTLTLKKCKRMITVIAEGASEEGNDDIVFNKLQYLRLEDFSKLTSFYSGKSVIRFPHLGSVMVKDCPEMKVFSLGIVSTPDLATRNIRFSGSYNNPTAPELNSEEIIVKDINVIFRQIWEDNLDANIQYLFAEEKLEENQSDPSSSSHVEEQQELY